MTISVPFDRSSRAKNPSVQLDDDLLDAIDRARLAEDNDKPMSRSAMIRCLIQYAIALMTDERAIAEFIAEHMDAGALIPQKDAAPSGRS